MSRRFVRRGLSSLIVVSHCGVMLLSLSGCGSARTDTVSIDSPQPVAAGLDELPWCQDAATAGRLALGASCKVVVQADVWNNRTGIQVCRGQTYRLRVPDGQYWIDDTRRSNPLQGDSGSELMNAFERLKRVRGANWFVLVAGVLPEGVPADAEASSLVALTQAPREQAPEPAAIYRPDRDGELVLFANDAAAPLVRDWLYRNNHGRIWAVVTLTTKSATCG